MFARKSKVLGGNRDKFVRLDEMSNPSISSEAGAKNRSTFNIEKRPKNTASRSLRFGVIRGSEGLKNIGRSLRTNVVRAVLPEDLNESDKTIFDPQDKHLILWNRLLVISCIIAVSIDPLFFYLPFYNKENYCLGFDRNLAYTIATLRSLIDSFYIIRIILQFRTAFIAPSSRVFGRGELVIDTNEIARRYMRRYFTVDILSILPLPQIVVWVFLGTEKGSGILATKKALLYIVFLQYIPRFLRFLPLTSEVKKSAGVFAETAWAGAAYYLLWFMLASHIYGAFWYMFSVERVDTCWRESCEQVSDKCHFEYLYCEKEYPVGIDDWKPIRSEYLSKNCSSESEGFSFGIYEPSVKNSIVGPLNFVAKYCYCLYFGLKNLSTLGQGLETSVYIPEVLFAISITLAGLVLFALLIGNMQTYLQSLSIRLEEMRIKRRDSEKWMHHRMLPQELRERVRRYDQYKWLETRGVDEEHLVLCLPKDLRRDIKRHLCLNLVRKVPLFANMDDRLLDAICERLKPSLFTADTHVLREGDPVDEMLFIVRGRLESVTTDGGRSGFYNRGFLKENDFCGEELLTWALDPKSGANFPPSTRTVKALTEVDAFALIAEELKFITSQFRRLHSRQVQHTFRFYSQQWRTWAASFIQAAWRRYSRRKQLELDYNEGSSESDDVSSVEDDEGKELSTPGSTSFGATILASRFAANALRGVNRSRKAILAKPPEPDFLDINT